MSVAAGQSLLALDAWDRDKNKLFQRVNHKVIPTRKSERETTTDYEL
jgi:hypothetical protein